MSRRSAARKRLVIPDPLFHSKQVSKLVNCVMKRGKKALAEKIVYGALELVVRKEAGLKESTRAAGLDAIVENEKLIEIALEALKKALDNASPRVEVKPRRVGGSTYQVPVEVRPEYRDKRGMRLIVRYAAKRGEKTMIERLASELRDAVQNRGGAVKECENIHKMAEANKAFAHYRW
jgi:small subunit ribosomal protein S7